MLREQVWARVNAGPGAGVENKWAQWSGGVPVEVDPRLIGWSAEEEGVWSACSGALRSGG